MSSAPLLADSLDLNALPTGQVSRVLVCLVEDGLGRPVRLPLLVARGRRPGPVFGMTAALHGNELNGVFVLQRLFREIDVGRLRGTLVGVIVANPPAVVSFRRTFIDGQDLNHLMPGRPDGSVSELFAHRLLERIVRRFDLLVDLHTASFGRVNCLYVRADLDQEQTRGMAAVLKPEILLHAPARDGSLRGAAMEMGIPAVTLEIGNPQRYHRRYVAASVAGLRALLGEHGLLPRRKRTEGKPPVVCSHSVWLYTQRGGFLEVFPDVVARVEQGERIALLRDAFGDLAEEYRSPAGGVVIGRSVNPVGQAGARILHLGFPA